MSQSETSPSTWALINTFAGQAAGLLQTELRLVRAEIGENVAAAGRAAAYLAAALLLALGGFLVLLQACVSALAAAGLATHWAGLLVAAAALAIAALLARSALAALKPSRLMPVRSLAQIDKDLALLRRKPQ